MKEIAGFISFINEQIENCELQIVIKPEWSSEKENYRLNIRQHLATVDSSFFNRQQLAELFDLNKRPRPVVGSISISHSSIAGGFSYSTYSHGFDIESVKRITDPIIIRTSSEDERSKTPHLKFLWVAKEAAYKALADHMQSGSLILTDLICKNWLQTSNMNIWSFQIGSEKKINTLQNIGYVFSTHNLLISIFFR
jgi:phosphopantetheinyl transferase (holo-ACP synthase)